MATASAKRRQWLPEWKFCSRSTLILAWIIPFVVYCLMLIMRPWVRSDDFSGVSPTQAILTIAPTYLPILVVMIGPFCDKWASGRLRPLTVARFYFAFVAIVIFHLITAAFFCFNVFAPDFATKGATYSEMFEGSLCDFSTLITFLSTFVALPATFLFDREPKK